MAAIGFEFDSSTGAIRMNAGDTGSFVVHIARSNGEDWPDTARMLYTIRNGNSETVIQRLYRLDDAWEIGDGMILIEFHNDDTDSLEPGDYSTEMRVDLDPIWEGEPITARSADYLRETSRMVEGVPVRTVFQGTLHIEGVSGRI